MSEIGFTMMMLHRTLETLERRERGPRTGRPAREIVLSARSLSRAARRRA
jgi:hypothetical protein